MAQLNKIDSNSTGLRYQEETSIGVANVANNWEPLEPNGYTDFGGELTTIARNPINTSRQRKFGVVTDLDASGGFGTDLTQENLQDLLQGFFFADSIEKGREIVTAIDLDTTNPDEYEVAATADFLVGSLIIGKNMSTVNNGLNVVTVIVTDTSVEVADGNLEAETVAADAEIFVVGNQAGADDIDVDVTGAFPAYTSSTLDFTTLGLSAGDWMFVGGDSALLEFSNAVNNGFKRIRTVAANLIEIDKSDTTMVDETSSGSLTIQFFFGRLLKNQADPTLQVRRTYQLERTLGAPDDTLPSEIQAEYIEGAVPSEFSFNIPTADKLIADLSFVGIDNTQIDGPTSLKSGTRPSIEEADAFNTSSDFSRIKMNIHSDTDENPTALFAFLTELTLTINNSLTPNKAVGVLGAFEVTAGTFVVNGSMTAYFSNVSAIAAVRDNSEVTIDFHLVKSNAGITVDIPLLALGDGRANIEQDQPITLPLSYDAATGAKIDSALDHTILMVFYDYLPTAADT